MRINNKKRISPFGVVAIIVAVILLGAGSVFAYQTLLNRGGTTSDTTSSGDGPIPTTPTTTPDAKGGEQFTDPEVSGGEETSNPTTTSMQITALNQNDGTLQIRTLIQAVWSSGSCTLTLAKGSSIVEREAPVQALPSSSTCQGFDIPVSELSAGEWSVSIEATHEEESASVTSRVVVQ